MFVCQSAYTWSGYIFLRCANRGDALSRGAIRCSISKCPKECSVMRSFFRIKLLCYLLYLLTFGQDVLARPCGLTDPEGQNPDNLCHEYTFTPGVHTNAFRPGGGRPVRGLSTTSNQLGPILIDPGQEFWTEIKTQGGSRRLKTSGNKSYTIPK